MGDDRHLDAAVRFPPRLGDLGKPAAQSSHLDGASSRLLTSTKQLYQAFYGLFVCPWYSYSQIMISEVTPRGHEFLFFSLFSIIGKTSSFIGPLVSSAIIDASPSGNVSTPFYFLFALSVVSFVILVLGVDLEKSRREQEVFLREKARMLASESSVNM
jgi:MFS-type transporter involved in bile tolerance (Atg22 family)